MTSEEFQNNARQFEAIMARIGNIVLISVIVSFTIYGIGFWIWYSGDNITAIAVVIVGYLLFRMHRKLAIALVRRGLANDADFTEASELLRRDSLRLGEARLLAEINAYLAEEKNSAGP